MFGSAIIARAREGILQTKDWIILSCYWNNFASKTKGPTPGEAYQNRDKLRFHVLGPAEIVKNQEGREVASSNFKTIEWFNLPLHHTCVRLSG